MRIWLTPAKMAKKQDPDLDWKLEITDDSVQLFDEQKQLVSEWSPKQFVDAVELPGIMGDRNLFMVRTSDKSEPLQFFAYDKSRKKLIEYHEDRYILANPSAASTALILGLGMLILGFAVVGIAGYISLDNYQKAAEEAAKNPEGARYTVWKGPIILGILMILGGFGKFFSFFKWNRVAARQPKRPVDNSPPPGLE